MPEKREGEGVPKLNDEWSVYREEAGNSLVSATEWPALVI